MPAITAPTPSVRQVSAEQGKAWILAVLAKRAYRVLPGGQCVPSPEEAPLSNEIVTSPDDDNLLVQDLDVLPNKPRTDVIVKGHAYAGTPKPGVEVSIQVGRHRKDILVVGDRRCTISATGALVLSAAEPFERMPMTFARAYGGRDRAAEQKHGNPYAPLGPYLRGSGVDVDNQSPYVYPKNPCGRGYLVEATPDAVEQCLLPNLEDPLDPLEPGRLVVGSHDRWIHMPIPQGLGWVNWGWFPRVAFSGLEQEHAADPLRAIPEVARGLVPRELAQLKTLPEHASRFLCGAPTDLQLPFLAGDEAVELVGLHPSHRTWRFRLPGRPARMAVDGREGKLLDTTPVPQTVEIEPDLDRVTVVWRGSAVARRPYFPKELKTMPFLVEW